MKKLGNLSFLLVFSVFILFTNCSEDNPLDCTIGASCDDDNSNTVNDAFDSGCNCIGTLISGFDLGNNIQIRIAGKVSDESGNPVVNSSVSIGNKTTTTDNNGIFHIEDVTVKENLAYVKVESAGYFDGSRSFLPSNGVNEINIRLLTKNIVGDFSTAFGGNITSEGVEINFPSNGYMVNGLVYDGDVYVALNYIDPENDAFEDEMPGGLFGIQDGNGRLLKSYGMIAVELTDEDNNEVTLADDVLAEVHFPIPASLQVIAPSEIDLWSFDETNGYWIHEGIASQDGNKYIAQLAHFSFWNCDVPVSFVNLKGRVVDGLGNAIQGLTVTVQSSLGDASDFTSSTGHFGGFVPDGEILNLKIKTYCNEIHQEIYSTQIGPLNVNTTLDDIVINPDLFTLIMGSVNDCDSNPVNVGYINAGGRAYYLDNGLFSFTTCGSGNTILTPFQTGNNQWVMGNALSVSLNGTSVDVGALEVCDNGNSTTVTDIDGNVYETVIIGTQEWMKENLNTTKYSNGDPIPNVTDINDWVSLSTGAWVYYNNDAEFENPYGKLYNWFTVADSRNVCPTGWHVPSNTEVTTLFDFLGGASVAGSKLKEAGFEHWSVSNDDATNESGFTALPGGELYNETWTGGGNHTATFWTSTYFSSTSSRHFRLSDQNSSAHAGWYTNKYGVSIRCLKD